MSNLLDIMKDMDIDLFAMGNGIGRIVTTSKLSKTFPLQLEIGEVAEVKKR